MPTTLPTRFRDGAFARKRGFPHAAAALMMWAAAMLAVSAAMPIGRSALAEAATVQP